MAATPGYQLLVETGATLTGTELFALDAPPSDGECDRFLKSNAAALDKAREALQQHCAVSLEYDEDFFCRHSACYDPLRNLARSFDLELRASARDGKLSRAVDIGLTMFDLANATRRGGFVVDAQVAGCIEGMAIERLRGFRSRLLPADALRLANELLSKDAKRESFAVILARDRTWEQAVGAEDDTDDICEQLAQMEVDEIDEEESQAIGEMMQAFCDLTDDEQNEIHIVQDIRNVALARLLAIELTLFAYRAENGDYPPALSALAPGFIRSIPFDPYNGEDFNYRITPSGFLFYSPGPSGRESGGDFGNWLSVQFGEADLCLDVNDYQIECRVQPPRPNWFSRFKAWFSRTSI